MFNLVNYNTPIRWPGFTFVGAIDIHFMWLIALSAFITLLLAAVIRRLRSRGEGEPYRTQLANAQQLIKVQKEGFEAERQLFTKRLNDTQGHVAPLCTTINAALGPSYPAKSAVTAIEAVKEFQDWSERFTAELKNAAPATFANYPLNVLAQHGTRDAFKAFVLRNARASGEQGAEALAAKDRSIASLEAALRGRDETMNTLRDELTRLVAVVDTQRVRIAQLETEIPALKPDALDSVRRVSKSRD